jgi:hypothetical protein
LNLPDSGIESHSGTEKSKSDNWLSQSLASLIFQMLGQEARDPEYWNLLSNVEKDMYLRI